MLGLRGPALFPFLLAQEYPEPGTRGIGMRTWTELIDGSTNPSREGAGALLERTTAKARVFAYLDSHPELARRPSVVASTLHVNRGSAKRLLHEWRQSHAPKLE